MSPLETETSKIFPNVVILDTACELSLVSYSVLLSGRFETNDFPFSLLLNLSLSLRFHQLHLRKYKLSLDSFRVPSQMQLNSDHFPPCQSTFKINHNHEQIAFWQVGQIHISLQYFGQWPLRPLIHPNRNPGIP